MPHSWCRLATRPDNKLFLGFEGEEWVESLNALIIPVPETDKHVIVTRGNGVPRNKDKIYLVNEDHDFIEYKDMLMLAAAIHDMVKRRQGV